MDAWNEASRRYITIEPEFYVPSTWRCAPENKKQGSGGPASSELNLVFTKYLRDYIAEGQRLYDMALQANIAPEQARLLLPAYGMHTIWRWTGSLQSIAHFINQRVAHDAQFEIQVCARAVKELITPKFPVCMEALVG